MTEKKTIIFHPLPPKEISNFFNALAASIIPKSDLKYETALDLLVAVVLSAQCTDKKVNAVTETLWKSVRTPQDYLNMGLENLENAIHSLGFFHAKAKHILELCQMLLDNFNGEVPSTIEELTTLPGVGRKTANVVLNVWFGKPTIAVDTHVHRVSNRCGLSKSNTPEGVEQDLLKITPQEMLKNAHHYLLLLGRYTCKARTPECSNCPVNNICPKNLQPARKD